MANLRMTIVPKSDQLNADDLIGGVSRTIKITKVSVSDGGEQPVIIHYEGDGGKPYKPGKSMRRVLVAMWGDEGDDYVGRFLTLYRDDRVIFGGEPVGGLRISHASHIEDDFTMALTASRKSRKPFVVHPMPAPRQQAGAALSPAMQKRVDRLTSSLAAAANLEEAQATLAKASGLLADLASAGHQAVADSITQSIVPKEAA